MTEKPNCGQQSRWLYKVGGGKDFKFEHIINVNICSDVNIWAYQQYHYLSMSIFERYQQYQYLSILTDMEGVWTETVSSQNLFQSGREGKFYFTFHYIKPLPGYNCPHEIRFLDPSFPSGHRNLWVKIGTELYSTSFWLLLWSHPLLCNGDADEVAESASSSSFFSSDFYRTQVNLGTDLWVRMSVSEWVRHLCET